MAHAEWRIQMRSTHDGAFGLTSQRSCDLPNPILIIVLITEMTAAAQCTNPRLEETVAKDMLQENVG
jgi:hypothetical protein